MKDTHRLQKAPHLLCISNRLTQLFSADFYNLRQADDTQKITISIVTDLNRLAAELPQCKVRVIG